MQSLLQDLRYAARMLRKNLGFTVVAVLTLALGIGANTAIFSVVNAVLLRPLPYLHPDRLVFLSETSQQIPDMSISMADFNDWRAMNSVFESTVAYQTDSVTLTGQGQPEELQMRRVTAGLFPTLGVRPTLGRPLGPEDDKVGAAPVVMLSDTLWSTEFGRDPKVIGKVITLDGESFTVIGVLPSSHFHETWHQFDVFTSLWRLEDQLGGPARRDNHPGMYAYALLKPGVTVEQARAQMVSIAGRLSKQYVQTNLGISASVEPLLGAVVDDVRPSLLVLMGAVGFVLLIGCANVANLLVARATERQREVAIRKALGAGRWRLARQLLTESVLLAFLGGVLGLLIAWWATQGLASAASGAVPRIGDVRVDGWVLAFTFALSLLTGIFFGIFPVLHASRADVNDALKENTPGSGTGTARRRLRDTLVVGELAISLVLLVGAGLTLESLFHVLRADPGFKPGGVLTARFSLPDVKYKTDDQRRQFVSRLTEKLAAIPGVQAAGFKNPLLGGWQNSFAVEGQTPPEPGHFPSAEMSRVSPGALEAMNAELLRGRFFTPSDNEKAAMACVVDNKLAAKYWPDQDPIGKHVFLDEPKPGQAPAPTTIVGVIREIKNYGVDHPVLTEIFVPFAQRPGGGGNLVIRSAVDASGLTAAMRDAVQSLDPDLPIYGVRTLESFVAENIAPRRLSVLLLSLFAGLALLLAGVGIYGVISYSVTQRLHEIGIRMALGASPRDIVRLVVGQGARLVAAGVAVGIVCAFGLTRLLSSLLFGVSASDPLTFAGVVVLLATVALAAGYIPARRASRTDPLVALRYE
ncbi:MAG TPA: ABC transporter permease [Candidatus Acidoferrales bacterium]|nr:ABC transporter permease [Candidatus Acidoferrales bacterium]